MKHYVCHCFSWKKNCFCLAQCVVYSKVYKAMLYGTSYRVFWWIGNRVLFCFFFSYSFGYIFTSKVFRIAVQKISRNCLVKILSMTVFNRVYFMYFLLFPLLKNTYWVNYFSRGLDGTLFAWRDHARFLTMPFNFYADLYILHLCVSNTWKSFVETLYNSCLQDCNAA